MLPFTSPSAPALVPAGEPRDVGSLVDEIAPGVGSQPELYALVGAAVVAYKHRAKIAAFFKRVTGRARVGAR